MPTQAEIDALNDAIAEDAQKPQSASVDGNSVTQVSVRDKAFAADRAAQQGMSSVSQLFGNRTRLVSGPRQ